MEPIANTPRLIMGIGKLIMKKKYTPEELTKMRNELRPVAEQTRKELKKKRAKLNKRIKEYIDNDPDGIFDK